MTRAEEFIYSPLEEHDIPELANALHSELVYQYIGGMPSRADFDRWLRLSIAGPPSEATGERWLNFTVRLAESREVIGRLEANIHDHLAELAFLYNPRLWGCGYASQGCKVSCAKMQASNRFGLRRILRINAAQACFNVKAMCGCQRRVCLRCIPMTAVIMCTSVVCEENQKRHTPNNLRLRASESRTGKMLTWNRLGTSSGCAG